MAIKYQPKIPDHSVNIVGDSPVKQLGFLLFKIIGIFLAFYLLLGFAIDYSVPYLPASFEKPLANNYLAVIHGKSMDFVAEKHLQEIVSRLLARSSRLKLLYPIHVHVVNSGEVNALSFPEGHIVFYRGLLTHLNNDDEIAFVLGHELGHYAHKDQLRGLGRNLILVGLSSLLFSISPDVSTMINSSLSIVHLHFSREQELAADRFGLKLMEDQGYKRQAAINVLTMFKSEAPWSIGMLSTHPDPSDRLKAMEKLP